MARQRRGGGFRTPRSPVGDLGGTLGTLLRTTLAQVGPLRDALERGAREGRSRLDDALSGRRRQDALAQLGEIVLELIRRGEIDADELPEVHDVLAHLDELDRGGEGHVHVDEHDERSARAPAASRPAARSRDRDDGTVSSKAWAPARPRPGAKVWRPVEPEAPDDDEPDAKAQLRGQRPASASKPAESTARLRPARKDPAPPARKGGISFDDDEDLAEYMHPEDVPPKPPKGSPGGDP